MVKGDCQRCGRLDRWPGPAFATVVVDCDSTLVDLEGIEWLSGHDPVVARWTEEAMAGQRPLEEVYAARLERVRPSAERVAALGQRYIDRLLPDAAATVAAWRALGKRIVILSAAPAQALAPLGAALGLPAELVVGVPLRFDASGAYIGVDPGCPLVRADGKVAWLAAATLPRPRLLVGDGSTDAAARSEVEAFVAFTGVRRREAAVAAADAALERWAAVLAWSLTPEEAARLRTSPWADVLARGDDLLTGGRRE